MVPNGFIVEGGGNNGSYFRRNLFISEDKIQWLRDQFNNTDVYTTVLCYNSNYQCEALKYGPFYIDLDHKDFEIVRSDAMKIINYLDLIYGIPKSMLHIYFSGNKGIHIIAEPDIFGIQPCVDLNDIYRLMAEELLPRSTEYIVNSRTRRTLDIAMYDIRRLFRLTNSINSKSGLYKIPLTYDELVIMSETDIRTLAINPREMEMPATMPMSKARQTFNSFANRWRARKTKTKFTGDTNGALKDIKTPPCIQYLLNNTTPEGARNEIAVMLSSFFNQQGLNQDEALSVIGAWSNEHCDPPLEEREIRITVASAYCKGYKFGCRGIKRFAECDSANCSLTRRQ
jgi:hypothetical protein